jgi:hypothetical protein
VTVLGTPPLRMTTRTVSGDTGPVGDGTSRKRAALRPRTQNPCG